MVHKIHQGGTLVKQNYNYANLAFNLKGFSMLDEGQRMCTVCHDNTDAMNADNWTAVPSEWPAARATTASTSTTTPASRWPTRPDLGVCHRRARQQRASGGTARADASCQACSTCHEASTIRSPDPEHHQAQPGDRGRAGQFTYEIKSAAVNATTNDVTIEFRILQRVSPDTTDTPVTFVAPATPMSNPLAGFTGGPSFLLAYAKAQDGIATPVDYNNSGVKSCAGDQCLDCQPADTTKRPTARWFPRPPRGYYTATSRAR